MGKKQALPTERGAYPIGGRSVRCSRVERTHVVTTGSTPKRHMDSLHGANRGARDSADVLGPLTQLTAAAVSWERVPRQRRTVPTHSDPPRGRPPEPPSTAACPAHQYTQTHPRPPPKGPFYHPPSSHRKRGASSSSMSRFLINIIVSIFGGNKALISGVSLM